MIILTPIIMDITKFTIPQLKLLLFHVKDQIMVCSGYDRSSGFQKQGIRSKYAGFTKTDYQNALVIETKIQGFLKSQKTKEE